MDIEREGGLRLSFFFFFFSFPCRRLFSTSTWFHMHVLVPCATSSGDSTGVALGWLGRMTSECGTKEGFSFPSPRHSQLFSPFFLFTSSRMYWYDVHGCAWTRRGHGWMAIFITIIIYHDNDSIPH